MEKSPEAFRTISEVAQDLGLPQHVLRFWETRFAQIRPLKRGGGRRYYRPDDVELLKAIRHLLYAEGYTIKGVQRLLKDRGVRAVIDLAGGSGAERRGLTSPAAGGRLPAERERPTEGAAAAYGAQAAGSAQASTAPPVGAAVLSREDVRRLRAMLIELAECQRMLVAAQAV
jgi:DNA-binding transcriptional MerR regulator